MTLTRIETAIRRVCREIFSRASATTEWVERTEKQVYREMVACILGSRVPFETALAATNAIAKEGLLQYCGDEDLYRQQVTDVLRRPMSRPEWSKPRRYRFPQARAESIASSAAAFYSNGGTLKEWFSRDADPFVVRRYLVENAKGIGPKQASMILRNIGFSNQLAILDSHLLRFMMMKEILPCKATAVSRLPGYETAEQGFKSYSDEMGWSMGILDQAVWVVMRVYLREAQ